MTDIGQVDTCLEVTMMHSHLALPRGECLNYPCYMRGYLNKHHKYELVFDASDPTVSTSEFERIDGCPVSLVTS